MVQKPCIAPCDFLMWWIFLNFWCGSGISSHPAVTSGISYAIDRAHTRAEQRDASRSQGENVSECSLKHFGGAGVGGEKIVSL